MFLAPLAVALLVNTQLSPITATFGTPSMVLRLGSALYISPDGTRVTDGERWIDLSSESVVRSAPLLAGKGGLVLLADGNYVRDDDRTFTRYSGKTGKLLNTLEGERWFAIDPTGRRVARLMSDDTRDKCLVQMAEWPKADEPPVWATLAECPSRAFRLTFNPTGTHLAWQVVEDWQGVKNPLAIMNVSTAAVTRLPGSTDRDSLGDYLLSPDGATVVRTVPGELRVEDVDTGKPVRSFPVPELSRYSRGELQFTPDGTMVVASGLTRDQLDVFPTTAEGDRRAIPLLAENGLEAAVIAPDGRRVVVRDDGGVVRVYDLASGKRLDRGTHDTWIGMAWAGPNKAICWSTRGRVALWHAETATTDREFSTGSPSRVGLVVLSPDGKHLAVTDQCREEGDQPRFRVIALDTGKRVIELDEKTQVGSCIFHPDGDRIAVLTPSEDREDRVDRLRGRGFRLAYGRGEHQLRIYPLTAGAPQRPFVVPSDTALVRRDGRTAICTEDGGGGLTCVETAGGGERWSHRRATGRAGLGIHDFERVSRADAVGVDEERNVVWAVVRNSVREFDGTDGRLTRSLPVIDLHGDHYSSSADGRWLVVSGITDGGDRRRALQSVFAVYDLWADDRKTPPLISLPFDGRIAATTLSPDAKRLLVLMTDGEQKVWDLDRLRRLSPVPDPWLLAWSGMAGKAGEAAKVMAMLKDEPERAVKLLSERMSPTAEVNADAVEKWIGELGAADFKTRDTAEKSLEMVLDPARRLIRAAVDNAVNAEAADRLDRLVAKIDHFGERPESLRLIRTVEMLERLRTPEAVKLLEHWAGGAPNSLLTTEAKASLKRVKK